MKKLKASDIIPVSKLLANTGLRDLAKDFFKEMREKKEDKNGFELAVDFVYKLLENMDTLESSIFGLVAFLYEKEIEEIKELPLGEFADLLKGIFTNPEFASFFKFAAK